MFVENGAVRKVFAALCFCLALLAAPLTAVRSQESDPFDPGSLPSGWELTLIAEGFTRPVQVVDPGDGSGRLFVVEQTGAIRIIEASGEVRVEAFLDISDQVSNANEQGLLGMAFHPDFVENGAFFIDYTDLEGDTQVERWRVSEDDPNLADPNSAETILTVDQPAWNHNGGLLLFDADGYLYVGLGDGGGGGGHHGQDLSTLLGSILRIDVDRTGDDKPYAIPEDNPFVGREGAAPEIWAYGLRNPWRFSFDRETGDLWIGDVGSGAYEEIDLLPNGGEGRNFGWNVMEGPECYQGADCDTEGLTVPVFAYTHEFGCSVVGGYVYRGEEIEALRGIYLFADYCSGLLWGMGQDESESWVVSDPIETGLNISSFGEDAAGELYVTDLNGGVYKFVAAE